MNRRQRARKHERRKAHNNPPRPSIDSLIEDEIARLNAQKKGELVEYGKGLGLSFRSKDTKAQILEMIEYRLRNNAEHKIAA